MHNALLCVAAAAKMVILVDGESFSRRLQDDYSSVACTTAQPDDSFYCNSIEGMEQSRCTCGSCDQNKQSVPDGTLPAGRGPCGGLCSTTFSPAPGDLSQVLQRAELCVFPDGDETQDGTCRLYSCRHFTKEDCGNLQPMMQFMNPGAEPADYFSCEQLTCVSCQHDQCLVHQQSGCMYDATLNDVCQGITEADDAACGVASEEGMLKEDCEATLRCVGGNTGGMLAKTLCEADGGTWSTTKLCQTGVQAKYDEWRYSEPTPANDPLTAAQCGYAENPTEADPSRGTINPDYVAGRDDASFKCTCDRCWQTVTDFTNRNSQGGYKEYCNLHVCTSDGENMWEGAAAGQDLSFMSAGASRSDCDGQDHCKTFKEIADAIGASPEVLMAFAAVCGLLISYCLCNIACSKSDSKEYDSDHSSDSSSSSDHDSDGDDA